MLEPHTALQAIGQASMLAGNTPFELVEQRLREAEELFRGLFQEAPVACHELDLDGRVTRVNQAECHLMGFTAGEMLGHHIWEFTPEGERHLSEQSVKARIAGQLSLAPFERSYTRRDGTQLVLEIHTTMVRDAMGNAIGLRSFMFDVTTRKRAELALQGHAEELSRSNADLEQFAYVASHDLQEPLRKIQAFGERLQRKYGTALGTEGVDYLTRMESAAARMQALINDLLALSRVSRNDKPFVHVDLTSVMEEVAEDLEEGLQGGVIEYGALPVVHGDRMQLGMLLQNLVANGLKFRRPGIAPRVRVSGTALPAQASGFAMAELVVEDNGIGFEQKYGERIFQVFQRLHGKNEYAGTGIGLAICRKIAERHGGRIVAEGRPGEGARFTITLPTSHFATTQEK
jgi:PAS domain S-box-containing protein